MKNGSEGFTVEIRQYLFISVVSYLEATMVKKTVEEPLMEQVLTNRSSREDPFEFIEANVKEAESSENEVIIFKKNDVQKALDKEFRSDRKDILTKLYNETNIKLYAAIKPSTFCQLDALARQFANFDEVVELCKTRLRLFNLSSPKLIALPPILLSGPPGIGKTRFLKELASVLETNFYSLDFSTISSSFILNGGHSSWADSKPGFISDSLRHSDYANPIILLDEIDKVGDKKYDPLGCPYALLERHTAKNYKDEYLLWFATANYPDFIPAPIRSRMTEVQINAPDEQQSKTIVRCIYQEIIRGTVWVNHFYKQLDEQVIELFSGLSPREMKKGIEAALACAAERAQYKRRKIKLAVSDVREIKKTEHTRTGIGFLAQL